jgi:hypothetical protein
VQCCPHCTPARGKKVRYLFIRGKPEQTYFRFTDILASAGFH